MSDTGIKADGREATAPQERLSPIARKNAAAGRRLQFPAPGLAEAPAPKTRARDWPELLFFQASNTWDELNNRQTNYQKLLPNRSPQLEEPGQPEPETLVKGEGSEQRVALLAYKAESGESPGILLVVYDEPYDIQPREYLEWMRASWENSEHLREIEAPTVRNFGHRDNHGYLMHFMSPEFLYVEFVLFVRHRAVHLVFRSPHKELLQSQAHQESFFRQVNKELEQGLYIRKQKPEQKS
ncbi:hypothetical protein P0082_12040 [Candidatus Haliotispira prima]|uniref:DUF1795 domain-containing protein n=1 Tax=Candidatus Haliotispira prima TaxID=3034016 RepID=A0ABY8MI07_9SPIO|nr:hypothetical protein P0082_12040 [Candidatus Haliotispira prima]